MLVNSYNKNASINMFLNYSFYTFIIIIITLACDKASKLIYIKYCDDSFSFSNNNGKCYFFCKNQALLNQVCDIRTIETNSKIQSFLGRNNSTFDSRLLFIENIQELNYIHNKFKNLTKKLPSVYRYRIGLTYKCKQ